MNCDAPVLLRQRSRRKLAAVLLSLPVAVAPAGANALAISAATADARLSVDTGGAPGVDVLSFVNDDGQDPFTTFAFRDPDGIPGSSAASSGAVTGEPGNVLAFTATGNTRAEGAPEPLIEIAWGQTTLEGGFLLLSSSDAEVQATLAVEWSWAMDLFAAGSPIDLALGQVLMQVLVDGVALDSVVNELIFAPPDGAPSNSGLFSTVVSVPAAGAREVSLSLFTLSLAQATVPFAVPEPASLALMLAGVGWLVAVRRRRARRSSKSG